MAQLFKGCFCFPPKMASSRWVSEGHLWLTGSGFSNAWTVLLLVFHPLSLVIATVFAEYAGWCECSLAFVRLLAWPAADHNSALPLASRPLTFKPFICLALGGRGVNKGGGWNLEVS